MKNVYTRPTGYSLLEMIIVVAILSIAAAVAVPVVTAPDQSKLDLASSRVADAVRFAREEARRTGASHGLSVDITGNQVRVFRLDELPEPDVRVFDVRDPISKQLLTIQINAAPHDDVAISSFDGTFSNSCNDPDNIVFDPNGTTRCVDPLTTRIVGASIELGLGEFRSTIAADGYTGRVVVQ